MVVESKRVAKVEGSNVVVTTTMIDKMNPKQQLEALQQIEGEKQKLMQQINQADAQKGQLDKQREGYEEQMNDIIKVLEKRRGVNEAAIEAKFKLAFETKKPNLISDAKATVKRNEWQDTKHYAFTVYQAVLGKVQQDPQLLNEIPASYLPKFAEKYLNKEDIVV